MTVGDFIENLKKYDEKKDVKLKIYSSFNYFDCVENFEYTEHIEEFMEDEDGDKKLYLYCYY